MPDPPERERTDRLKAAAAEYRRQATEERERALDAAAEDLLGGPGAVAPGGIGRRSFFGASAAALLCTVGADRLADAARSVPLDRPVPAAPPGVKAAAEPEAVTAASLNPPNGGKVREYWIGAVPVRWTIVPKRIDEWNNTPIRGKTSFTALAYRRYTANWANPMGPPTIPGPTLAANVNDYLLVHFKNFDRRQTVTMHPHGVYYNSANDGAHMGKYTKPAGFIQPGRSFTYLWQARQDSVGVWAYHDHGPNHTANVFRGLFGAIVIRDASQPQPDVDHVLVFHTFTPATTRLRRLFYCANGRAYAGNTPTLTAKVGQKVAFHVIGTDGALHNFHLHGHRFRDEAGTIVDTPSFGPAETCTVTFTEDNPGRWLWHCHIFSHMDMGMAGWYLVSE